MYAYVLAISFASLSDMHAFISARSPFKLSCSLLEKSQKHDNKGSLSN